MGTSVCGNAGPSQSIGLSCWAGAADLERTRQAVRSIEHQRCRAAAGALGLGFFSCWGCIPGRKAPISDAWRSTALLVCRGWEQQGYRDHMAAGPPPHGADCRLHRHNHPQLWRHQFLPEGWVGFPAEPSWAEVPGCPPSPPPFGDCRARWTIVQPKKRGFPTGGGLRLPSKSGQSSHLPSCSCRSKKFNTENGADDSGNCLEAAWWPGAGGTAHHGVLKTQMSAWWDILPAQKEMGEGSCAGPGNTLHRRVSGSSTS